MALAHALEYLTYEDYYKLDDDVRYELIDGVLYNMAAPTLIHQDIVLRLGRWLGNFLEGKKCKVFISPVDVRLNADKFDDIVVQPDVIVVCDKDKIGPKNIIGAPDLIIEVLSPSSGHMDKVIKHKKYLEAGVREYWIVDPSDKTVSVNLPENKKYYTWYYGNENVVPVHVLEGMEIDLAKLFLD